MPHRLQLQELVKKTVDCSNTPCTHAHAHRHTHTQCKASEVKESGESWHTHSKPTTTYTHIQTLGAYLRTGFVKLRPSRILLSGQIRYRPGRPQNVLWFFCGVWTFISPVRMQPIPSTFLKHWPGCVYSSVEICHSGWVKFFAYFNILFSSLNSVFIGKRECMLKHKECLFLYLTH